MRHAVQRESCRRLLRLLSDYIDEELEAALCQELEAHLAACENCRIVVDTLRKMLLLYRLAYPPTMPAEIEKRLFKMLDLESI
jgi:anti-sigma factor RsiW